MSKVAKKSYQKMQPMTAKEKQLRDAEAAAVYKFMRKAPIEASPASNEPVKTLKIKDTIKTSMKAATLLQKTWRKTNSSAASATT